MDLVFYAMGCFFLPGLIWMIAKRDGLRNQPHGALHVVWSLIFMLYGFMAVHLTAGIGTIWDLLAYGRLDSSINLIPLAAMDLEGLRTERLYVHAPGLSAAADLEILPSGKEDGCIWVFYVPDH